MAQSLTISSLLFQLNGTYTNTLNDTLTATHAITKSFADTLATGTSADQSDRFWSSSSRTLADAATETFDLYDLSTLNLGAGAGKDPLGQSVAFVDITCIAVFNNTTAGDGGKVIVGGDGTAACWNSWANGDDDAVTIIPAGGLFTLYSPADPAWAVADTSNHLLKVTASGSAVTYDIFIVGRSA
jgi:hypothetical protein